MIGSNYFDLAMVMDYWSEKRLNHHTEAASMLYAARECARIALSEGLPKRIARHRVAGAAMAAGVEAMGLKVYGDRDHKMFNATGAFIPDGVNGESLRKRMREEFEIEIGTSFGPLAEDLADRDDGGECAAASCGAYADGAGDGAAARGISSGGVWSGCGAGGL